jgi:hypothetical protein
MLLFVTGLALFSPLASAGKVLWDGRFNGMNTSEDLGKCKCFIVDIKKLSNFIQGHGETK